MNAWTPYEPDTRRARELDELLRKNPENVGGRAPMPDRTMRTNHRRRIAYLRRCGRYAEADAEAKIYAERWASDERERILASQIERERR